MKRQTTVLLALVASVGISAAAQAQTKPKAFTINEVEVLDKAAVDAFEKAITPAVREAGGRALNVPGGKIIARVGVAPKAVVLAEWDSLEKAEAYYKSIYNKFAPQRDKAWKVIRSFVVEGTGSYPTLQGSKVYAISEYEPLDKSANDAYSKLAIPAVQQAGGRPSGVGISGKIVARVGEAPKGVTLVGWDSIEKAEAYYKSPTSTSLQPQSDKARKVTRSFLVEAAQ
jgi:uncharacterized protein (DUF1330 family)